jgi:hypothetical protein
MTHRYFKHMRELLPSEKCIVCSKPATIQDLEYDGFYCEEHAERFHDKLDVS